MASVTHQALLMASSGVVAAVPRGWQQPLSGVAPSVARNRWGPVRAASYANDWLSPPVTVVTVVNYGWSQSLSTGAARPSHAGRTARFSFLNDNAPFFNLTFPTLSGLLGWWDASVFNSLMLSGTAIASAADQSGNGNTIVGGTVSPQYNATGFNGRPSIQFSDSATLESLFNSSIAFGTGNELTIFAAATLSPDLVNGFHANGPLMSYTADGATSAYNNVGSFGFIKLGATNNLTFDRNAVTQTVTVSYDTPMRIIFTLKSDGTRIIYIDGAVASSVAGAVNSFATPGYLSVGGSKLDSSFFGGNYSGQVGEIGIANAWQDATTVAALDAYLKAKWGL